MDPIDSFTNEWAFLSNFFYTPIPFPDSYVPANTVEHYFQAYKSLDPDERTLILSSPLPAVAKKIGRKVTIRSDWEQIKFQVMLNGVRLKFGLYPELAEGLLSTGDRELVEGNNWGDRIWGKVDGEGANWLGQILMQVRKELRSKDNEG